MLIFNCTQATQDFFTVTRKGTKQTIIETPPSSDMGNDAMHLRYEDGSPAQPFQWVLHTVSIKRKNCLIAMELNTRFAVTVAAVKKADLDAFLEHFKQILILQVLAYANNNGIWQESDEKAALENGLNHMKEFKFFRRSERSVQAHINDLVLMLRDIADENSAVLEHFQAMFQFNYFTNNKLRRSKAFPAQSYITPYEEMLIFWQQHCLHATQEQLTSSRQRLADNRRVKYQDMISDIAATDPVRTASEPPADKPSNVIFPNTASASDVDLDFLDTMLAKYATDESLENFSSLHGFLTAIVSAPNMMLPSQWLAEIWGGEDLQPAWKNIDEAQRFMGVLFSIMNNISEELMQSPKTFSPVFMGNSDAPDVSEWCFGYICAVDLDEDGWDALPDNLQDQLELIDNCGFVVETSLGKVSHQTMQKQADQVVDAALQLHAYWLKQRTPMRMPSITSKPTSQPQPVVSQKVVGRNDPCPCGSGKKFKKCCLH